jgi:hypothetical protein
MNSDALVARQNVGNVIGAGTGLTNPADPVNTASPAAPRKRRRATNDVPLAERVLIEIDDAAKILSVSHRTMKRIAADNPQLTALINRRRLFVRAKLLAWVEAGGDARS